MLAGALSALWVMTALSAVMGWAAPALVRRSCAPLAADLGLPAPMRLSPPALRLNAAFLREHGIAAPGGRR